jgi:precorrin-6B methylase 2
MDRYELYELCVQSPRHAVALLRHIHAGNARTLAEDFCGTAAVSREWVTHPGCTAVARDLDPVVIERARSHASGGVTLEVGDATVPTPGAPRADIIFVGNFSIGEIHQRLALVAYLRHSLARLNPSGVFVCDTYGGESAFRTGGVTRTHLAPDGSIVRYTWQQRAADPATARVENALHFRVERAGEVVLDLPDAFVYHWRLWSVPELRDAMEEAGFTRTTVHHALPGEEAHAPLAASHIVCVAGHRD